MENPRSEIGGDSRIGPMIPPSDAFIRDTNTVLGAPQCLPVWGLILSPAILYTKNIDTRAPRCITVVAVSSGSITILYHIQSS